MQCPYIYTTPNSDWITYCRLQEGHVGPHEHAYDACPSPPPDRWVVMVHDFNREYEPVPVKSGGRASFRRCAAVTVPDGVLLSSPRNSEEPTLVSHSVAMALADEILESRKGER